MATGKINQVTCVLFKLGSANANGVEAVETPKPRSQRIVKSKTSTSTNGCAAIRQPTTLPVRQFSNLSAFRKTSKPSARIAKTHKTPYHFSLPPDSQLLTALRSTASRRRLLRCPLPNSDKRRARADTRAPAIPERPQK